MADVVRFRGSEIERLIITELDAEGRYLAGGFQWITCCDIDSVEVENDQDDRERYVVPNANRTCRVATNRQAILYGKIVRIGFVGDSPFANMLLLGADPNFDGDGDIIGNGEEDYVCKYVSVEIVLKGLGDECVAAAGGRAWKIYPKVGQWGITQAANVTNSNEVGVTVFEGVGVKNPNYNDVDARWLESPAQLRPALDYSSWSVNDVWEIPECPDELIDLPDTDSSSV